MLEFDYQPKKRLQTLKDSLERQAQKRREQPIPEIPESENHDLYIIDEVGEVCCAITLGSTLENQEHNIDSLISGLYFIMITKIKIDNHAITRQVIVDFMMEELDLLDFMLLFPALILEKKPEILQCYKELLQSLTPLGTELRYDYATSLKSLLAQLEIPEDKAQEIILLAQVHNLQSLTEREFVSVKPFEEIAKKYQEFSSVSLEALQEIIADFAEEDLEKFRKLAGENNLKQVIQKNIAEFLQDKDQEHFANLILPLYQSHIELKPNVSISHGQNNPHKLAAAKLLNDCDHHLE